MKNLSYLRSALFISCAFFAAEAFAGKAIFHGQGRILGSADHVELRINVLSECYRSAKEAVFYNDEASLKIMELLKPYVDSTIEGDGLFSNGGYTERYTGYDHVRRVPVCVNSYRKINQILLRSSRISSFAQDFAYIQDIVYSLNMDPPSEVTNEPLSSLTISQPVAGLKYENHRELQTKTLGMALADAKKKFEATMQEANVISYKIIAFQESGSIMPYPHRNADGSTNAPDSAAPVAFDKLIVQSTLSVEFEF